MFHEILLRKIGLRWEFISEATLENFVWDNLTSLFNLTPLKRQHNVNGQFCDIIAVDNNKHLVVLELKNSEDRYIVQQLTRYYDALLEVQDFTETVDYTQPVSLVAITPKIHRDNLIDRKYHTLSFKLMEFHISHEADKFYFYCQDIDNNEKVIFQIPYHYEKIDNKLPAYPKALLNILSQCGESVQKQILKIRSQILYFDERMEEMAAAGSIKYGMRNKFCVELCLDSKKRPTIFIWLHKIYSFYNKGARRIRFCTEDWKKAHPVGYISKGLGDAPRVTLAHQMLQRGYGESLEKLVDIALETWRQRL